MNRAVRIVRPNMVQAYEPGGHVKTENRRLLKNDHVEIILARMTMGGGAQGHVHKSTDQIVFILNGTGSVMKDDKVYEMGQNILLYIPAGTFHGGEVPLNRTDALLSFLVIYSPPLDPLDIFPIGDYMAGNSIRLISPDQVTPYQPVLHAQTENRRLLKTGHIEIILGQVGRSGVIQEHVHETSDQIVFVLEGKGSLMVDGMIVDMEKGTLVYLPRGFSHGGKVPINRTNEPLKSLVIYSPPLTSSFL